MRRLSTAGVVFLALGLVISACSSGDDEPEESSSADSAAETTVSFGGSDETAAAAVGDDDPADSTNSDESDDPTASSSPAVDDVAAIEAEVERVIRRNWEIWIDCTTDSDSCDPETALAETESTTSQFYLESVGVVESWKDQGIAYRPVEGRAADRFVEIQSIDVAPDRASAELLLCDRDDRARFERNTAGDYEMVEGTDFVEDLLLRRIVALDGEEWKIVENELLERRAVTEGIDPLC